MLTKRKGEDGEPKNERNRKFLAHLRLRVSVAHGVFLNHDFRHVNFQFNFQGERRCVKSRVAMLA